MIDQNKIVMEAGRLDDVEVVYIVIAVAATPRTFSVGRGRLHDLFIILSLTCSRSLIIQKAW